jgi:hypothetical protein
MNKKWNTLRKFCLTACTFVCTFTLFAQGIRVSGTISDVDGNPLAGANISVKGTARGTMSNGDGQYTIQATDSKSVLVFSYIGYVPQEIAVGSRTLINVTLAEDQCRQLKTHKARL